MTQPKSRRDALHSVETTDGIVRFNPFTTGFKSDLCIWKPIDASDLLQMFKWRTDPRINAYFRLPPPENMQQQRSWFRKVTKDIKAIYYVLYSRRPELSPLGYCSFLNIDWVTGETEIGLAIADPAARGQGLGTRITAATIHIGHTFWGFNTVYLSTHFENVGALKLMRDKLQGEYINDHPVFKKDSEHLYAYRKVPFVQLLTGLRGDETWQGVLDPQLIPDMIILP